MSRGPILLSGHRIITVGSCWNFDFKVAPDILSNSLKRSRLLRRLAAILPGFEEVGPPSDNPRGFNLSISLQSHWEARQWNTRRVNDELNSIPRDPVVAVTAITGAPPLTLWLTLAYPISPLDVRVLMAMEGITGVNIISNSSYGGRVAQVFAPCDQDKVDAYRPDFRRALSLEL